MIARLERLPTNPLILPSDISFARASGTFNPGVAIDQASGCVVMLVRVFEAATRRSCQSANSRQCYCSTVPPTWTARIRASTTWPVQ